MTKKQPMPFMKLYLSILDDPDYIELSRTAKSLYFEFYLLAWNADAGGDILNRDTLRPFTLKNLAARLRTNTAEIESAMNELIPAGFVALDDDTWSICRYLEEQDVQEMIREKARERQARSRQKKKKETSNDNVADDDSDNDSDSETMSHVTEEQLNLIELNVIKTKKRKRTSLIRPRKHKHRRKTRVDRPVKPAQILEDGPGKPVQTDKIAPKQPTTAHAQPSQPTQAHKQPATTHAQPSQTVPDTPATPTPAQTNPEKPAQIQPVKKPLTFHSLINMLANDWRDYTGELMDMQSRIMIDKALKDGIKSTTIHNTLLTMAKQKNFTNPAEHLATCLVALYRDAAEHGRLNNVPDVNFLLNLE